jgi:hypothetical protein
VRHAVQNRLHLRRLPEGRVVVEEPALGGVGSQGVGEAKF